MAIPFPKRIFLSAQKPKTLSLSFSSSPPSDQTPSTQSLISTVVSLLTHHRSKSRWGYLLSLYPNGFTPTQFSQIALHLKNNPRLAQSFFLFTQHKSLCKHNINSYSTLIHILSRARLKTQAQNLIRVAIRASEFDPADVVDGLESKPLKVFETLVKTYRECGSAPFVFDLLIKSCLEAKKIDDSIEIVRLLRSRWISPKVSTGNALIWEVSRCRGAHAGYEIYREVFGLDGEIEGDVKRDVRVRPNVHTFNALMECFYQDGAMEKVKEIWAEMEEMGCVANGYSYSVLMTVFCDEGKMGEAEKLWEEMRVKKVEHDVVAYNTIIGGLCNIGEIGRAEEFSREMALSGIDSSCVTYEHLINGYCNAGDIDSAKLVYKDMCRKDFRPEVSTVDALIGGLCNKSRVFEALEILRVGIKKFGLSPSGKSYEFLIKVLCEDGKMEDALKLQAEMVGKGFEPNSEIYGAFIDGYMKQGNEEVAATLRKEMFEAQMRQEE